MVDGTSVDAFHCASARAAGIWTTSAAQVAAFMDGGGANITTDTDIDSHGVSDSSGQAQGHWQCAHRGRYEGDPDPA